MKALKELGLIITKNKVKSISIVGDRLGSGKKSKVNTFYEKLVAGDFETDEDAARYFYNSTPLDKNYKKLKSTLKNRLINTLFFIDLKEPTYSEFEKAYYACCKDWAAAKILFRKSARESGISICQKVFKMALKYEFTELLVDTSRILRLHHGSRNGSLRKFEYYNALFKKYEKTWQLENLAEEYYTQLVIYYVHNKSTKEELQTKMAGAFKELESHLQHCDSSKLHLFSRFIEMMIYMSVNDYAQTIEVCEKALDFFLHKPFVYKTALSTFYNQQLVCYTQLKEFQKGTLVARKCLDYLTQGSFNWFKSQELYFFLAMHTRNYQTAANIYSEVIQHKRFRFLPDSIKETWKIFEAYLYYLIEAGILQALDTKKSFSKFRVGKFLNEVPIFSKDKRGLNIPILVIQIMFFNLRKKYDLVIDRTESIEKYCSRHLRKNGNFRSNCFIKMLLQIPLSQFHRAGVVRKVEQYRKKLIAYPLDLANQAHEIEIIPYEELWELIIAPLDNSFHK